MAVIKKPVKKMAKKQSITTGLTLESSHGVSWVRLFLLGKGGFGSVFYAERKEPLKQDSDLPFQMAVKSAKMDRSSSLQYEKQVFSDLGTSPYVVRCYGDEVTEISNGEKIYNLLLEFCSGLSLSEHIRLSGGGLPEIVVQNYTRDILRGLNYIHSHGYVHCDIKPGNILLVPGSGEMGGNYMAKIADFGLAMAVQGKETECSGLRGTSMYMSPELVKDRKLDYSADIWALGCVVLEMLTAKPVWDYSDTAHMLFVIGYTDRVPAIPDHVSEEATDFLSWCFDRRVGQRLSADRLLEHPFVSMDDW
ncbi:hypothetical protein JCGZ_13145 [Jatropha curcas]|uniref:Protein kinase domain-containing protein n=1 Tax=Jatropha curcas TaxID=180498 RepID=A0A067KK10_JATCU|nr:mitogen-activated protein kinase kinase kinase 17 [Jatropha curcas]KDP32595.1 hypothetical protein JCGZ_13145 [Jatropha curcas]